MSHLIGYARISAHRVKHKMDDLTDLLLFGLKLMLFFGGMSVAALIMLRFHLYLYGPLSFIVWSLVASVGFGVIGSGRKESEATL